MAKEERKITVVACKTGGEYVVGEETQNGRVKAISFRRETHKTVGSSGMPCYVVQFVNNTVQVIVPYHNVAFYKTDAAPVNDEDVGSVPELPDGEE